MQVCETLSISYMELLQREMNNYNDFNISLKEEDPSPLNRKNRITYKFKRLGEEMTLCYNISVTSKCPCKTTTVLNWFYSLFEI